MTSKAPKFERVRRQEFRKVFQPSRIVLGVFAGRLGSPPNLITLCFNTHCSYKPPMFSFSVWKGAYTYSILEEADSCVLAVPGERMAEAAMLCGTVSGREVDKVAASGLTLVRSEHVAVPGIGEAIANIELRLTQKVRTGDHLTAFGEVLKFGLNRGNRERNLVSVGPKDEAFEVLARKGIHRIAVAKKMIAGTIGREATRGT